MKVLENRETRYPLNEDNGPASRGEGIGMIPLPDKLKNPLQEPVDVCFKQRGISPQDPKVFLTIKR